MLAIFKRKRKGEASRITYNILPWGHGGPVEDREKVDLGERLSFRYTAGCRL